MGIFKWLFGGKPGEAKIPDPESVLSLDFRKSERPVDRKWRWHLKDIAGQRVALGIAGINYRLTPVTDFVKAAVRAENSGNRYGILLVREPSNPSDQCGR